MKIFRLHLGPGDASSPPEGGQPGRRSSNPSAV
jgi:hypothetical protein